MKKVALTSAATVALSGVTVTTTTVDAMAHTDDVKVFYVCNTQTGNYDGTIKLTTSNVPDDRQGITKWRLGDDSFDNMPTSDAGMDRGPVYTTGNMEDVVLGTWSLPGTTTGHGPWVYAYTKWPKPGGGNYATKGSDGQFKDELKGDCSKPPTPPVTPPPPTTPPPYSCPSGTTWVDADGDGVVDQNECQKTPPPTVLNPKAKVHAYCVTRHWGEGIARLINKQSTQSVRYHIVRSGKDRVVTVDAGKNKTIELRHLRVGSVVKLKAYGNVLDRAKVRNGCGKTPPAHSGERTAAG